LKILVSDPLSQEGLDLLEEHAQVDVITEHDEEELTRIIGEYDALFVRSGTQVNSTLIEKGEKLKVIGRAGVGVDNIDVDKATEMGIMVLNAPEGNTVSTAEHAIAVMVSLARRIPNAHQSMQAGKWDRKQYVGVEMNQKTLGLFGIGRIGSEVARRTRAMGMKLMAYDPHISPEKAKKMEVELVGKEELLERADFITLHMPLTNSTYHFIGEKELQLVKPGVRIINCARGGLIDEDALVEALKSGRVAGAALDVFENEPLNEDSPLRKLDNVVLTPHLAASTQEAQINVAVQVAEQGIKALRGEPVVSAVNVPHLPLDELDQMKPYYSLLQMMGSLYVQIYGGPIEEIELCYSGEIAENSLDSLTTSCLIGILQVVLGEEVNFVNAPYIARSRGIRVREVRTSTMENYANLITLKVNTGEEVNSISATLFHGNEMRIVRIGEYSVDVSPNNYMLVCSFIDKPGMIGKVGMLFGDDDVNIAGMQVGRKHVGGEGVMVLQVDAPIPQELLNKVKVLDGIVSAHFVELPEKSLRGPKMEKPAAAVK